MTKNLFQKLIKPYEFTYATTNGKLLHLPKSGIDFIKDYKRIKNLREIKSK